MHPISVLYEKEHEIYFTHADLHLSNLMVQEGRLRALIDWEHAEFKLELWEYTKALWPSKGNKRLRYTYNLAFEEDYAEELEAELEIWRQCPTI